MLSLKLRLHSSDVARALNADPEAGRLPDFNFPGKQANLLSHVRIISCMAKYISGVDRCLQACRSAHRVTDSEITSTSSVANGFRQRKIPPALA